MTDKSKAGATPKDDPDREAEGGAGRTNPNAAPPKLGAKSVPSRIKDAYFLGGQWLASDGSPLTDVETQQVHRAKDKDAADARAKALRGEE